MWGALLVYFATAGLALSYYEDELPINITDYAVLSLAVLGVESTAVTVMYASELRRYLRVGRYIMCRIERTAAKHFAVRPRHSPLAYEHWLRGKHDYISYLVSVAALQLPQGLVLLCIFDYYIYPRLLFNRFFMDSAVSVTIPDSRIWLVNFICVANAMVLLLVLGDYFRESREYAKTPRFVPYHRVPADDQDDQ